MTPFSWNLRIPRIGHSDRHVFEAEELSMTQRMIATVLACFACSAASGQGSGQPPSFEVASVKPGGDIFSTRPDRAGGRIGWTTQLAYLIGYAYRLDFSRVDGPNLGAVYSLEAIFDPTSTDDQIRLMVQSLLTDRFRMRSHRVTTVADGYALSIAKKGLKIKEAKAGDDPPPMPEWVRDASPALRAESFISATLPEVGVIQILGRRVSMSQLAETLQRSTRTPVWDRTGLSGNYYFAFRYAQDPSADSAGDEPVLETALRESLGLELQKQKGPLETLVIDYIGAPSEN
ncbi:MAG: TIGR03435 family protein [Bryobacteraceae bacterium]|jgi:uncharacterized protein (TIGR03435 family)